ncbi:AMP-dependent synthetase/ligase [Treponema phagedenis]|uniref:AMP-dependent synthetase/ligase n=1 Tax=Treponema phagedenis TaxID=162 RepID=UPI0011F002F7|nr:long-chain fatty acid--CoA ligase [Treponema phagedenis]TYT78319.1 long-chain fatty acid--CoA ligase [Treponema phagedenis]
MNASLPQLLQCIVSEYPDTIAQYSKDQNGEFQPISYKEMFDCVSNFACGLRVIGCKRGDFIGLISDNRKEWMHASMGIMALGAADIPRGSDVTDSDIIQILGIVESSFVVVEDDIQTKKIFKNIKELPKIQTIIILDSSVDLESLKTEWAQSEEAKTRSMEIFTYDEIILKGKEFRVQNPDYVEKQIAETKPDDIATIIFTSGTTGTPKGVMLTHKNFLSQLPELSKRIILYPGERALSVLPVWHVFERLCEYVIIHAAAGIAYSKPIGSILLADFAKINPHLLPSVPRIWEAVHDGVFKQLRKKGGISYALFKFFLKAGNLRFHYHRRLFKNVAYTSQAEKTVAPFLAFIPWLLLTPIHLLGDALVFSKIRLKLGKNFRAGVSGGGALPGNIDEFFWTAGVTVVEGYGLTETAPVVAVRSVSHPIFGTIGTPCNYNQVKVVDDTGKTLPMGEQGVVYVRGDNVMKGYFKRPELTESVIDKDGWFNTGDIGYICLGGEIVLRGRLKDTIVLRGGENIEPVPIEMRLQESQYISLAVVVGQDQRYLGALILPDEAELQAWAKSQHIAEESMEKLIELPQVKKLFENEIADLISAENGFKLFEKITRFALLSKPFEQGVELSAKQEVMRHKINQLYEKEIDELFV